MKYLKPPTLSMNFSENKDSMKKRLKNILSTNQKRSGKVCLGILLFCVVIVGGLIGCTSREVEESNLVGQIYSTDLESAISQAILSNGRGHYLSGETVAEGHIVLETTDENDEVVVYALTSYGEYGFENGIFTKVSGTGIIPAQIIFQKDENGYMLVEYNMPKDGTEYAKSIKEMFPKALAGRAVNYTDWDAEKCYKQEYQYAEEYLKSIGRTAEVCFKVEKELANMNVTVSNLLLDLYHDYPYWIGTQEKLEHNERFVYEKLWEDKGNGDGVVTFKKYRYDDKSVVEEYIIEVKGEKTIYIKGEERITSSQNSIAMELELGETIDVDLDGDGKSESIFYSLSDFKINGVSYKKEIEDVYLDNPEQYTFIVADMDKSDKQKEIVLKVEGPSNDPAAHFYTYKNGLIKLGMAATALNYMSFDGEGNVYGSVRLDILQTWFAPETWSLNGNSIVRNTEHIYYPNQIIGNRVLLKEELPVCENLTDSKQKQVVKPQEVKITRTDNKRFCYLEAKDGTTGWFEVTDFFKLVDLDNKLATDVFEGLIMAD